MKFDEVPGVGLHQVSLPVRGAWIEIPPTHWREATQPVAPRTGGVD